jgi:hypothetical protein
MVANRGMAILLTNGLCSKRHYLPAGPARDAHLVLAMDNETCPLLERSGFLGPVSVCVPYAERMIEQLREWEPDSLGKGQPKSLADLTGPGMAENLGHAKKLLLNAKLYAVHDVLRCGFDAFLTDIDVVLMKDPLPLFASMFRRKFQAQMLFEASTRGRAHASVRAIVVCWCSQADMNPSDNAADANSGFFFLRRTAQNVRFMKLAIVYFLGKWWFQVSCADRCGESS